MEIGVSSATWPQLWVEALRQSEAVTVLAARFGAIKTTSLRLSFRKAIESGWTQDVATRAVGAVSDPPPQIGDRTFDPRRRC